MITDEKARPRREAKDGQEVESHRQLATTKPGRQVRIISPDSLAAILDALPIYAATLGDLRHDGRNRWKMLCPLPDHADGKPSFAIIPGRNGHPLVACSCGFRGDAVRLARTLNPGLSFRQAAALVATSAGITVEEIEVPEEELAAMKRERVAKAAEAPPLPELPPDFEERHRAARARLWGSPDLLAKAEEILGIPAAVIRSLCYTSDALGWASGRLCYLYEHALKFRNPPGVEPRFKVEIGRPAFPWRWHFAARPEVVEVFLTESESSAVALIASGFEDLHPKKGHPASAVIACPGNGFPEHWGPLFKGKRITLVFDWDGKSDAAREKTARILSKHASRLATIS
jgi:hypothetical protein